MTVFTATTKNTSETIRFRSLDALARRLGGRSATWLEREGMRGTNATAIQIVRPAPFGGYDILGTLFVPLSSLPTAD